MAVLALMFVTSFILGLIGRRSFAHFNLLFNRELAKTRENQNSTHSF